MRPTFYARHARVAQPVHDVTQTIAMPLIEENGRTTMITPRTTFLRIALCSLMLAGAVEASAQSTMPASGSSSATAASQPNNSQDVKLVAAVRRAITKDDSISTAGHNVTVLATNGTVTLRGTVKSDGEKARIESVAHSVNGVQQVTNELNVKP